MKELSDIQLEILKGIANGKTALAVSIDLGYATSTTVDYHLRKVRRILNAQSNTNAVYIAAKRGII